MPKINQPGSQDLQHLDNISLWYGGVYMVHGKSGLQGYKNRYGGSPFLGYLIHPLFWGVLGAWMTFKNHPLLKFGQVHMWNQSDAVFNSLAFGWNLSGPTFVSFLKHDRVFCHSCTKTKASQNAITMGGNHFWFSYSYNYSNKLDWKTWTSRMKASYF